MKRVPTPETGVTTDPPNHAEVDCWTCGRPYDITSNPHVEGIKYCPFCGSESVNITTFVYSRNGRL